MSLATLKGKVVESIHKLIRGHYNYVEYVILFTDGTRVRFFGDSSANVNPEVIPAKKKYVGLLSGGLNEVWSGSFFVEVLEEKDDKSLISTEVTRHHEPRIIQQWVNSKDLS
jgi:hypothetical protein